MKTKIMTALKTKYNNLGFSDKVFEGVADSLSKTVTEETQIETAIGGVEPLLKVFQGEIDKVRGESNVTKVELDKLKKEKAEWEKKQPNPEPPKQDDDIEAKLQKVVSEQIKPLQDKLAAYESKDAEVKRNAKILAKAQELQIPQFRIDEGFTIPADADDTAINTYLSKVKQNLVTAGLEKKNAFGNILATPDDVAKKEAEAWADGLKDAKASG